MKKIKTELSGRVYKGEDYAVISSKMFRSMETFFCNADGSAL